MYFTLKEVYEIFKKHGYLYKGKTVTQRTVKTIADNGLFKTLRRCECGSKQEKGGTYMVHEAEVNQKINE